MKRALRTDWNYTMIGQTMIAMITQLLLKLHCQALSQRQTQAGGIKAVFSEDDGSTFPYGISMVPGTTSSDVMSATNLAFYSNSDLDTVSASACVLLWIANLNKNIWQFRGRR